MLLSPPLTHALQIAANQQPPNHLTMTESMAEGLAKPQLDTETGEMVSKSELKKRLKKRAKNKNLTNTTKVPTPDTDDSHDPNAMFKQGFLAEVFKERPSRPVRTRFPPEPNGYLHLGSFDENLSLIEADCFQDTPRLLPSILALHNIMEETVFFDLTTPILIPRRKSTFWQ
jgi:hypothetical protein